MATIGINVSTNFDEAGKQLQSFTNLTNKETKRVQASLKRIETFEADSFVQQNKRMALGVHMTKGATAALAAENRGLERKIQMLVRNGIDPESLSLKKLQAEYKRTSDELAKVKTGHNDMKSSFMSVAVSAAGFGYAIKGAITAASDLEEATGKFNVVFSGVARDVSKDVDILKTSYAMSTREAKQNLAAMQDLLVPMGMNKDAAATMSSNIVKLAADLGSFNNVKTSDVMRDLQAALTGSGETMKKYGVVLTQTNVQQKALSMGLASNIKELTAADKAQAAYAIITAGSTAAIGDMARTSSSYANQQKAIRAKFEDFAASAGKTFIPIAKTIVGALSSVMKLFNSLDDDMRQKIVTIASVAGGLMLVAKASSLMGGSLVGAFGKMKAAMAGHPLLMLIGIGASLYTMFSTSGKSASDFEKDISSAENTAKSLNAQLNVSAKSFETFRKGAAGAREGTIEFQRHVATLLKSTPDLEKYGITTASSLKEIEDAQRSLTEAKKADAVIKAGEQYQKIVGNLRELRTALWKAHNEYKSDPTKENLAAIQKYQAMLKRSEIAMQNLGRTTGRTMAQVKKDSDEAGAFLFKGSALTDHWRKQIKEFGRVAKNVFLTFEQDIQQMNRAQLLFTKRQIEAQLQIRKASGDDPVGVAAGMRSLAQINAMLNKVAATRKKTSQSSAAGKAKDLTGEIQALEDANMIRDSFENDFDRKRAKLYLDFHRKEQKLISDNSVTKAQRLLYVHELELKLMSDIERVNLRQQKQISTETVKEYANRMRSIMGGKGTASEKIKALQAENQQILADEKLTQDARLKLIEDNEKKITSLKEQEEKARAERARYYTNFSLQSISSFIGAVSGLYEKQTSTKIANLDSAFQQELEKTNASDKEKERMQKEHNTKKAKIEYDAAMKSWRLSKAAAIADAARSILSAMNTKPFIPAGIAAAAVATGMAGIQLATLNASKPVKSAEVGGSFVVPGNPESSRGDSQLMRVNPGENVSVSPRGEGGGGRSLSVTVMLEKRTILKAMQEGIDSGEITFTTANLVPA